MHVIENINARINAIKKLHANCNNKRSFTCSKMSFYTCTSSVYTKDVGYYTGVKVCYTPKKV